MKKIMILITAVTCLVLSSCTVSEDMVLGKKNSSSSTDIKVYDFFANVLADQMDLLTGESSDMVDSTVKDLTKKLATSGAATDVILVPREKNHYDLSFLFEGFGEVLAGLTGKDMDQTIITETDSSLKFWLDMDNYHELEEAIPFLKDPNFEVYGPRYNQGIPEEDYLEMMSYMLSENDPDEAPDAIMESLITVTVHTPSDIKTVSGAAKLDSRTVVYELPLIDFLLMPEPLTFSVTW